MPSKIQRVRAFSPSPSALCLKGLAGLAAVLLSAPASAGGHFDVDDAGVLSAGRCHIETWAGHFRQIDTNVLHVGPSCGFGSFEAGFSFDRARSGGIDQDSLGPQVKWNFYGQGDDAPLSMAIEAMLAFNQPRRGSRTGGQLLLPVSWKTTDAITLHFNVGADWNTTDGNRTTRVGAQGEWALDERFTLVAERNRAFGAWTSRVGARVQLSAPLSMDLSVSRTSAPFASTGVLVGLTYEFAR